MQYIIFTQENLSAMYWIVFHLDMRGYSVQYEHPFISHQRVARKPIWYEMIQFQDRRSAAWCFVTEMNQIKSPSVNKSLWLVISHPVREYKYSLGFWISRRGFRFIVHDFSLCQWNLDSRPLITFRILWAVFLILKPRFPVSTRKTFPNSGFLKQKISRHPESLAWDELSDIDTALAQALSQWLQTQTWIFLIY